jgi:hypothetical protein
MTKILIDEAIESLLAEYDMVNSAFAKDLRQALANAALDKKADNARALGLSYEPPVQQEPVYAFRRKGQESFCTCDERRYDELSGKSSLFEVAVFYTTPPAPAQPCKYGNEPASCTSSPMDCQCAIDATYEQPAPEFDPDELTIAYLDGIDTGKKCKPWVGLTDEEIDDIEATWEATQEWVSFSHATRVIEAKLMEKNQ